ncbi:hypothetical protein [Bradyrhizobium sp. DASA03120]|uniref:hypothetical protein n=1 Tax=Bradyrhizobium sp. SMVTL-02 TaxID=3395917 RepID=UPI003F6F2985
MSSRNYAALDVSAVKVDSCARTMHEAAMTMSVYGSSKSRTVEPLNQAYREMTFGFFKQLFRYFALPLRVFSSSTLVRLKADGPPHIITAARSGECARHSPRCKSHLQYLKQAVESQIEEVARLICEDESALEATRFLDTLTSELVKAKLDMCSHRDKQAGSASNGGDAKRLEQEYGKLYEPEQLSTLGRLFDGAVLALPPSMRTPSNRIEIAKLILERASIDQVEPGLLLKLITALVAAA